LHIACPLQYYRAAACERRRDFTRSKFGAP
jgi:hypothetical protein